MLDRRYQRYWTIVLTYHQALADQRPKMLAGFIHLASMTEPDPLTRHQVAKFYALEALKRAAS